MGLFQRIFKVGQSEAHSIVDKLEDPIKMIEQGIRDLKKDLQSSLQSLAQVKAISIRLKKDADNQKLSAADFERKAMLFLQNFKDGELEKAEAERLATAVLNKKEEAIQIAEALIADHSKQQKTADQLQSKVEKLRHTINRYENELATLRARVRTASSVRKINQQLAGVDSSGTISMLEKMKNKVMEVESLAEAYGDLAFMGESAEKIIEKALKSPPERNASESLAALKKKMNIE